MADSQKITPETCGSARLLLVFGQNPKHIEHVHLKERYGGSFDPTTPPADEMRFEVLKLAKRWKPKKTVN
ncbi:MAG: hypothetical protein ACSHYC_24385 [Alphaproteobacteria bacterium]